MHCRCLDPPLSPNAPSRPYRWPRWPSPFFYPSDLALAQDGTLYVTDSANHRIRKITPDGQVSTVAGTGQPGYKDGPAQAAQFSQPNLIALGPQGQLYVSELTYDPPRIREISPDGQVSTFLSLDTLEWARPAHAYMRCDKMPGIGPPVDLQVTHEGELYVAFFYGIKKVNQHKQVETILTMDRYWKNTIHGQIAVDTHKNIYFADGTNGRISRLMPSVSLKPSPWIARTDLQDIFDYTGATALFISIG